MIDISKRVADYRSREKDFFELVERRREAWRGVGSKNAIAALSACAAAVGAGSGGTPTVARDVTDGWRTVVSFSLDYIVGPVLPLLAGGELRYVQHFQGMVRAVRRSPGLHADEDISETFREIDPTQSTAIAEEIFANDVVEFLDWHLANLARSDSGRPARAVEPDSTLHFRATVKDGKVTLERAHTMTEKH